MSKGAQTKLAQSKSFLHPSSYVKAMYSKYRSWVFDEEDCLQFKNEWRKQVFKSNTSTKLDLEIGPGAGDFFMYLATHNTNRLFIAVELKYKPLIQSAQKIKKKICMNAKAIRYNARMLDDIFSPEEINNIYIHFPDPWPKKRHHKHRLVTQDFVKKIYKLQRKNSFVEIKTDHRTYFNEIRAIFKNSSYQKSECYDDLHKNMLLSEPNFITNFEKIFIRKNQAIYYLKYIK